MNSRIEDLLTALLNGESVEFNPLSRSETYLKGIIDGNGTEGMPTPLSRLDILLYRLVDKMQNSGTGGTPDENYQQGYAAGYTELLGGEW